MNPCNNDEQYARQQYLEALYALDGRDDPSHPLHGTYTSLYINRQQALLEADKQALLGLAVTNDDDDTPLHELLGGYVGPGLIPDADAAAAICSAWCRILSSRLHLAIRRLDHPDTERSSVATESVLAIADWLSHEAVRADLKTPEHVDAAPCCVEPAEVSV